MQLLKTVAILFLMPLAWVLVIPGALWANHIFKKTGYRSVDLLFLLIPFYCWALMAKTAWRYVSATRYWEAPLPV